MTILPPSSAIREILHEFAMGYRAESKESRAKCLDDVLEKLNALHVSNSSSSAIEEALNALSELERHGMGCASRLRLTGIKCDCNYGHKETIRRYIDSLEADHKKTRKALQYLIDLHVQEQEGMILPTPKQWMDTVQHASEVLSSLSQHD